MDGVWMNVALNVAYDTAVRLYFTIRLDHPKLDAYLVLWAMDLLHVYLSDWSEHM